MPGVRRERVTEVAGHLQEAGLIQYQRSHIRELDRQKLEKRVRECYAVSRRSTTGCCLQNWRRSPRRGDFLTEILCARRKRLNVRGTRHARIPTPLCQLRSCARQRTDRLRANPHKGSSVGPR
jgi:hypothetical protein